MRSQPLNQEKFNLKISISQFILGVILTPVILAMSLSLDNFNEPDDPLNGFENSGFGVFFKAYMEMGIKCIFQVTDDVRLEAANILGELMPILIHVDHSLRDQSLRIASLSNYCKQIALLSI